MIVTDKESVPLEFDTGKEELSENQVNKNQTLKARL